MAPIREAVSKRINIYISCAEKSMQVKKETFKTNCLQFFLCEISNVKHFDDSTLGHTCKFMQSIAV